MMESVAATQFIRDEHKHMRGLFRQFEVVEDRAQEMSDGVMKQLAMEIEVHSVIEEEIFYEALMNAADPNLASLAAGCRDEHREIDAQLKELRTNPNLSHRERWMRLDKIIREVEEHMINEERALLPLAENVIGIDLYDLGAKLQERKAELMGRDEYKDALPEIVQNPNGGEQMRPPLKRAS